MRRIAVFCLAIVITGCATNRVELWLDPADTDSAKALLAPGTSTINGSALIRHDGGGVVTCAGNDVFLVPATPSATSEVRRIFGGETGIVRQGGGTFTGGGTVVVAPEPNRRAVCNAQGNFAFTDVRAGKWYLMTNVTWVFSDVNQGGTLLGTTEVAEGKSAEIVLRP